MSWRYFKEQSSDLALLGASLLSRKISFLATIRSDGSPRVNPVRPIVGDGYLFVFIDQKSPKRSDLLRDGRYAIHCSV
ncbi:MAG: pyridoxamine 5'-phosphate oxidase family protein, partial [Anaerolineales bacterium]